MTDMKNVETEDIRQSKEWFYAIRDVWLDVYKLTKI